MTTLSPNISPHELLIFADGASKGNPGASGWGALIVFPRGNVVELGGAQSLATNNQMELTAIVEALRFVTPYSGRLQICSDSSYVLEGIQKWVPAWRKNGWRTREGNPVANQNLWESLDGLVWEHQRQSPIRWIHLPGHAGIIGNERVDAIASAYAEGKVPSLYQGPLANYSINPYDISVHPEKMAAKTQKNAKAYSYLSMVDGEIVIHKTWPECQARVLGKSGAKFKKSISLADEATIIQSWKK